MSSVHLTAIKDCSSDTKKELISTSHLTFSSLKEDEVPSTPNFCSAEKCGTRYLPTTNLFDDKLSTTPMGSVCNSQFPGTQPLLSTSQLLLNMLKVTTEPPYSERGLHEFSLVN